MRHRYFFRILAYIAIVLLNGLLSLRECSAQDHNFTDPQYESIRVFKDTLIPKLVQDGADKDDIFFTACCIGTQPACAFLFIYVKATLQTESYFMWWNNGRLNYSPCTLESDAKDKIIGQASVSYNEDQRLVGRNAGGIVVGFLRASLAVKDKLANEYINYRLKINLPKEDSGHVAVVGGVSENDEIHVFACHDVYQQSTSEGSIQVFSAVWEEAEPRPIDLIRYQSQLQTQAGKTVLDTICIGKRCTSALIMQDTKPFITMLAASNAYLAFRQRTVEFERIEELIDDPDLVVPSQVPANISRKTWLKAISFEDPEFRQFLV